MNGISQTDPSTGKSSEWKAPTALSASRGMVSVNAAATQFAISPDGKMLALAAFTDPTRRSGYTLFISDLDGQNARSLFPAPPS
jgi:Tol biopolymer transport system component